MKNKEKWVVSAKKDDFAAISEKFGIDQVTARLIRNRGVIGVNAVQEYLYGSLSSLPDPYLLLGCQNAAELILQKIREHKKIRIIGDYDIDGVFSTYIFYCSLKRLGADVDYAIPDRIKDGYGLNFSLVENAFESGTDTILTCDNGISAISEISLAKKYNMTVIVTDHHEPMDCLPEADVIVNPHQPHCNYPYKNLCGSAVAWKVVCALFRLSGLPSKEAENLIPYVGFATVGDVMPLTGENRILVKEGLRRLQHTENLGLLALMRSCELQPEQITSYHIGYVLGPCINAAGRLSSALLPLELLLTQDESRATNIADQLSNLNQQRKSMTQEAVDQACSLIENDTSFQKDRVLVIYLQSCHESIAGIVAGKIREIYYKPTFIITDSQDICKGSGRSIPSYSMFDEMKICEDLYLKFGGHPMAAGFSLEKKNITKMRQRLNEACALTDDDLTKEISIDVPMPIDYISEKVVRELSLLEPTGTGNEKPLFAEHSIQILSARIIGKKQNTIKMRICNQKGCKMDALYFGDPNTFRTYLEEHYSKQSVQNLFLGKKAEIYLDLAYYPSINEYRGVKSLEIVIQSYKYPAHILTKSFNLS